MADRAGQEAKDDLLISPAPLALSELAIRLQEVALAGDSTVATAESCTGGLVSHAITEIAGSSAYYRGGVVSYADQVKINLLAVPGGMIERHGAVSAQVAVAMAEGIRKRLGTTYAVAVTGIAGPDGGSADKPVGLTYVATAGPDGEEIRRHRWGGDRHANKEESARAALQLLAEVVGRGPMA